MVGDDYPDDDFYDGDEEPRFGRKTWIGAILAILIVAGFGVGIWYAYDQGVKKGVQLAPPIISADTTPVKKMPDNPGGMDIPNQDKQVFSVLKSGDAPEKVEKLMPPPENSAPQEKTEEMVASTAEKAADESKLEVLIEKATKDTPTADTKTEEAAKAAETSAATKKVEEAAKAVATPSVAEKVDEKKVVVAAAPVPKKVEEPKKASAPKATGPLYRVQVGSFRSADAAEKQWSILTAKFKSLLSGKIHRVQDVEVKGKGLYYRLQVGGYDTRDSANKLCSDLKAKKQDCLVVRG